MNTVTMYQLPKYRSAGFTLIEVLIAILVLAIGLLGLAAMQGAGLKYNTDAYQRTQATVLAYDIVDRMRANKTAALKPGSPYIVTASNAASKMTASKDCDVADGTSIECSETELAAWDVATWLTALDDSMSVDWDNNPPTIARTSNQFTITIRWRQRTAVDKEDADTELDWVVKQQQWVVKI
jgi:type IV pilus assembly protein PilV